ncbi:MAG TPA: hypothetical protein VMR28_01960 [Candidatus Saccharimonadales bacterium]|nr:hypothetical protein [Candidatus Saccharimonadales bacterium]
MRDALPSVLKGREEQSRPLATPAPTVYTEVAGEWRQTGQGIPEPEPARPVQTAEDRERAAKQSLRTHCVIGGVALSLSEFEEQHPGIVLGTE